MAAKVPPAGATAAKRRGRAAFSRGLGGKRDERQVMDRTRRVKAAAREVEEDLGTLKRVGHEFFEAKNQKHLNY